jgi:hypothetical protein
MNCKNVEISDNGLIIDTAPHLLGGTEANHECLEGHLNPVPSEYAATAS